MSELKIFVKIFRDDIRCLYLMDFEAEIDGEVYFVTLDVDLTKKPSEYLKTGFALAGAALGRKLEELGDV